MRRILLPLLAFAALFACSSSSEDSGNGSQTDDVVTARCPATVTIGLAAPKVFKTVPSTNFDGTPLTETQKTSLGAEMEKARTQSAVTLTAGNLVKSNATCTYTNNETRVVLRTKNGQDRVDISHGSFRVFAFPESFDPTSGVRFAPDSSVGFFANIGAGGPFSDGASLTIRIGRVVVSSPAGGTPREPTRLRVPVLLEDGELAHDVEASLPKTLELDGATGPKLYSETTDKIFEAGFEPMRFAGPNDYETKDPSTTICFSGSELGVCDLLPAFTDNLFSDMFGIAQNDDEELACEITPDAVTLSFFMSESDFMSTATIPRCK